MEMFRPPPPPTLPFSSQPTVALARRRYHMYCLSPPLETLPRGDWFCPNCIAAANDAEDLGFNSGRSFTLDDFQKSCHDFNVDFFDGEDAAAAATIPDIEEAFWRMVEEGSSGKAVDVHYGADVDTSVHGSGFPSRWDAAHGGATRDAATAAMAEHPWNLNNLPRLAGEHCSLLRQVNDHIPGVLVPWLYVGSMFSSFCWHFEDHMLYSINYNHLAGTGTDGDHRGDHPPGSNTGIHRAVSGCVRSLGRRFTMSFCDIPSPTSHVMCIDASCRKPSLRYWHVCVPRLRPDCGSVRTSPYSPPTPLRSPARVPLRVESPDGSFGAWVRLPSLSCGVSPTCMFSSTASYPTHHVGWCAHQFRGGRRLGGDLLSPRLRGVVAWPAFGVLTSRS